MSAVRAMQEWCRLQCEGYSGVQIRDLSSSFRDGLAFCALIHRHRPDLIDFDSLSKENVYENNKLAFEVAEQELGIPALLDPTDMVSMKVPDRLSIMTYLSQYYNYFRNPPPAVLLHPPAVKRSAAASSSEPALKKIVEKAATPPREDEELEPATRTSLSSTCASCHRHVHLVQRFLVEGCLYHRQCFRCKDCCGTLLPGSYMPGPESGTFVCTHHRGRGSTISSSVLTCHQDDRVAGGIQDSCEERGKGGQEDSATIPSVASESMPVPVGASEDLRRPLAGKSDGNEAHSLAGTALSSKDWVKLKEQDGNALEVESSTHTNVDSEVPDLMQDISETGLAKPRPQIQCKPALPIKPTTLQEHTATTSPSIDSGGSSLPINLQHHNHASQRGDRFDPCIPISLENQSGTSHLSNDTAGVTLPISPQNWTAAASPSCDTTELPTLIIPEDSVGASSSGSCDVEHPQVPEAPSRSRDQGSRPIPAARRPMGTAAAPQTVPVPRPRSTQPGDAGSETTPSASTQVMNGVQPEPAPPVPKPRSRPKSSERLDFAFAPRVENGKPHKEPPWIALVQEKRRKAAPPPPGTPPRAPTEEQLQSPVQDRVGRTSLRKPPLQPKPYNPFEYDEDDEPEASDTSLPPSHPWYGITPTSSPKAKKRAAPKAPNASPLARHTSLLSASRTSHSEPSSCTPSPALSVESLSSDPSLNETVSKSSSEPAVHAAALCPTNGGQTPASFSAGELAHHGDAPDTSPQSSRSSSCGSLKSSPHRPPPPKPTAPSSAAAASQEGSESVTSPPPKTQPKSSCKENPFNRKASPVISPSTRKSTKGPKPARPPAPGHGFPLVKRKVQADQYIPEEDIHGELNSIERQLDEMELRGIELEGKLRSLDSETEDDDELLVDWFRLIHEKHMLVRRESELVYVIKQQNLEQRQADVEYELRCLLNKPEKDWTEDDRAREQVLMAELVTIIEQRNAIVTCLDEDRQREEEEDKLLAAMIKKKDFHKDSESTTTTTKKKGKFKPLKALKMLSSKPDPKAKSPKDKS